MTSKATFPELLNQLYFTAIGVAPWEEFLFSLAGRLEANCAGLMVHDPENREYSVSRQIGVSVTAQKEYAEHYGRYDIHFQAAMATRGKLHAGMVQLSQNVIPVPKLLATYYYNDFLRRYDILHQCGAVIAENGSRLSTITFTRPHGADAFAAKEQRLLTRLTPHLQAAFALHRFLTDLRLTELSLQAAFDASPHPSLIVNRAMKILAMNSKAKAYTDGSRILAIRAGQLVAVAQPYTEQLKSLVRLSDKTMAGRQLQIAQPNGTLITVAVTPLLQDVIGIGKGPAILIAVEDPLLRQETLQRNLIRTYGLTVSEARVAQFLLDGKALAEISANLHVTRNTLKTHLSRIFLKTATRRQAELVGLLQRSR
jgi:DNA-binding CsgD family transcriptional regulator